MTDRAQVVFRMTGQRSGTGLAALEPGDLRPALLARYGDLTSLRYDFPLVLGDQEKTSEVFFSLSGIIDDALRQIAQGDDGERVSRQVLRLERHIRTMVARGAAGSLSALWQQAAAELTKIGGAGFADSLDRARAAIAVVGEVVDCDADLPGRVVRHAWAAAQAEKAARFHADADRLVRQLSDILRADVAGSAAGRTAAALRASVGSAHDALFDFEAMSRVLTPAGPPSGLSETRRQRIQDTIATIASQDLYPPAVYVFTRCSTALEACRSRRASTATLARAIAIAALDAAGEYRESTHDAFFAAFGANGLDPEDLALFPDYLVSVNAAALDPIEQAALLDLLSAGLPMKVLVQWDDLLDESSTGGGQLGFSLRSRRLAHLAMALNDVYVLQSPSAHLFQMRDRLRDAMAWRGPSLVSVFSGATGHAGGLPAYLVAAAALTSRTFPAVTFDPSAGSDWASRLQLARNPQADRDWPVQPLAWEDDRHQRASADVAFTLVDFAACDERAARHFARVPRAEWNGHMIGVPEALASATADRTGVVPSLMMVDRQCAMQRVIVDDRLIREARRCREVWNNLQELGRTRPAATTPADAAPPAAAAPDPPPVAAPARQSPAPAAAAPASGDPYIETPRCSTCNECTRINPNMFAYNENKQAYIRNPDAGTYAQLVEAAESCQLAIIHPGHPRNPNEPGLADLVARAEIFQAAP